MTTTEIPITTPPIPTPVSILFTVEEEAIITTAMSILPHLGPDATVAYLTNASGAHKHEA